jgi:hypothetical protein
VYLAHVAALETVQNWDTVQAWVMIAAVDTGKTIEWAAKIGVVSDAWAIPIYY